MIHAAPPLGTHHGPKFVKACRDIGMTKNKPTSASASPDLRKVLERVSNFLGPFPHDAMVRTEGVKMGTNGGYWPSFESPVDPRYRIQIRDKALIEFGPPLCPLSGRKMVPAKGRAPKW